MMYMSDSDPERGENVHVLMPVNYLGNVRLLDIVVKLKFLKLRKGIPHLKQPDCCKHCLQCKTNVF